MAGVKMIVLYPTPTDLDAFERDYTNDHVPLARKINGMTKFVASKVLGAPGGAKPPFVRVAELYFPSMEALQQSATNPDTQAATKHAVSISSGGMPVFLVCDETVETY